jgi:hypothetical protein
MSMYPKTKFWKCGQDLIDYSLVMAFVAMASASLFLGAEGGIQGGRALQGNPAHQELSAGCR